MTVKERFENRLKSIKLGCSDANGYHDLVFEMLNYTFGDRLKEPKKEVKINEGRKRVDIVWRTLLKPHSFFYDLNSLHHIKVPYVWAEVKNYSDDIKNPEIDQLSGRFSKNRGEFGMLICRNFSDRESVIKKCRDVLHDNKGVIIALDEKDLLDLVDFKDRSLESNIDDFFHDKLSEIILN